jgi:hypothetical protein
MAEWIIISHPIVSGLTAVIVAGALLSVGPRVVELLVLLWYCLRSNGIRYGPIQAKSYCPMKGTLTETLTFLVVAALAIGAPCHSLAGDRAGGRALEERHEGDRRGSDQHHSFFQLQETASALTDASLPAQT